MNEIQLNKLNISNQTKKQSMVGGFLLIFQDHNNLISPRKKASNESKVTSIIKRILLPRSDFKFPYS